MAYEACGIDVLTNHGHPLPLGRSEGEGEKIGGGEIVEVYVRKIVFGAEIKTFGLDVKEVREILSKTIKEKDWKVSNVRMNGSKAEIELEVNIIGAVPGATYADTCMHRAKDLLKLIESEIENYATIKHYFTIYSRCNGQTSEAKEIMRKVGIPVIS